MVVVRLPSVHLVLRAEKLLHEAGLTTLTRPVPGGISADCGICLEMASEVLLPALQVLTCAGLPGIEAWEQVGASWARRGVDTA